MSDIPENPAAFRDWLNENSAQWPADLQVLGQRCLLAMQADDQLAARQSKALGDANAKDIEAFRKAYAAWRGDGT